MYYDVQRASQLNDVFTAIAQNLANLRIAKIANRRERSVRTANEKARPEPGFCFQPSAAITSRLPWRYRPQMAGRPPAQDRHKARRTWSPGQGIARRRP